MLFSSFPDYTKKIEVFFLNLAVILSIPTACLRLIRVEASHEAYINNLGNTFMATIACKSQSYAHELGHILVTFDSRVGSGILA